MSVSSVTMRSRVGCQTVRPAAMKAFSDPAANHRRSASSPDPASSARSRTCSPIATQTRGSSPRWEKTPYGRLFTQKPLPSGTGTQVLIHSAFPLSGDSTKSASWRRGPAAELAGRRRHVLAGVRVLGALVGVRVLLVLVVGRAHDRDAVGLGVGQLDPVRLGVGQR